MKVCRRNPLFIITQDEGLYVYTSSVNPIRKATWEGTAGASELSTRASPVALPIHPHLPCLYY